MDHVRIKLLLGDTGVNGLVRKIACLTLCSPRNMNPIPKCSISGTIEIHLIAVLVPEKARDSLEFVNSVAAPVPATSE